MSHTAVVAVAVVGEPNSQIYFYGKVHETYDTFFGNFKSPPLYTPVIFETWIRNT
jgi:hypothetical protein